MPNLHWTADDVPATCDQCEWEAVFRCAPCDTYSCGKHRAAHYVHNLTAPEEKGKVKK